MTRGRKQVKPATSSRTVQTSLSLAPPAAVEEEPQGPALAAMPMVPAYVEALAAAQAAHARKRGPPPAVAVRWVTCERCGKGRRVGMGERHGAMPVRAAREGWPRCVHGVPHWENCVGAPVDPECCVRGAR
ncbi:hypothetical protein [Archangium violaceum]|uniref:hypothetical protein n=1 Tax=Archangium violaceum TaxID=83451 RepID=UPI0036DC6081